MKTLLLALSGAALLVSSAWARPIHWNSDPRALNLASDSNRMSADYRFELGVFRDGFIPTVDNMEAWADYWAPAQRVTYHAGNDWFAGRYIVEDNLAPFTVGARAWIWGFSGDSAEGEWLLFRATSWRWPRANAAVPVALEWSAAAANEVLAGDVGNGTAFLLCSARMRGIQAPATTYGQWLAETGATPGPDALSTFFSGGRAPLLSVAAQVADARSGVVFALNRLADRRGTVGIEYSTDLVTWHSAEGRVDVLENGPTGLSFRPDGVLGEETSLFFRARLAE